MQNKRTKHRKYFGKASAKNCWCDEPSIKVIEYSGGSKRGRKCRPKIYNWVAPLRWTDLLLLGQSNNAITCYKRLNLLGNILNSQYQVKSMIKEKASLMQKHDEHLFGHITDTIKSKKQTKEIFIEHKKTFHLALHTHRENVSAKMFSHNNRIEKIPQW